MSQERDEPRRWYSRMETDAELIARLGFRPIMESLDDYAERVGAPRRIIWVDG